MNKIFSTALLAVVGLALTGCDNLLDDNRYPETSIVNSPLYWSNPDNCDLQVNRFYQYFYGYGNGNTLGSFYFNSLNDDQTGTGFVDWTYTNIPASSTNYTDPYVLIRGCNLIIQGVEGSSLTAAQKANYIAQARLMRGYEYYTLVQRYGDVVLVEGVLDPESEELYDARTDRKVVMDYAFEDLKFAAENISLQSGKQKFSKDLAMAILSDFCLYEGTFWKYCTKADNYCEPDAARSKQFLEYCAQYSAKVLPSYPIGNNYAALYNSTWNGDNGTTALKNNGEVIFACEYEQNQFMHSTTAYTCSSTAIRGITKDAFDAFLFVDGKPLALTNENKTDAGKLIEHAPGAEIPEGKDEPGPGISIEDMLKVRDARLSAMIDPFIYYKGTGTTALTWTRWNSNGMTSSSGYGCRKFDNEKLPVDFRVNTAKNYISAPMYWGAIVALNLAEAKAELGTLSDADLNSTLNKLYARANLPAQTVASLSAMTDPNNNMGVSNLLWEVRRCRRCELMMDKNIRYWDLVRWHQLELLDSSKHPNIMLGANYTGSPVTPNRAKGNYVDGSYGGVRIYDNRQYEWPIPTGQITVNPNLKQNANWN